MSIIMNIGLLVKVYIFAARFTKNLGHVKNNK